MKIGPAIQRISQRLQRQPLAVTAKPERRGPKAGPQYAAETQTVIPYGRYSIEYMSCIVAGPFARQGLPKKPCRNRSTSKPAKLLTSGVGIDIMTKNRKVTT